MLELESQARVDSLSRVSAAGLFPVPQATQDIDTDDVDTNILNLTTFETDSEIKSNGNRTTNVEMSGYGK